MKIESVELRWAHSDYVKVNGVEWHKAASGEAMNSTRDIYLSPYSDYVLKIDTLWADGDSIIDRLSYQSWVEFYTSTMRLMPSDFLYAKPIACGTILNDERKFPWIIQEYIDTTAFIDYEQIKDITYFMEHLDLDIRDICEYQFIPTMEGMCLVDLGLCCEVEEIMHLTDVIP